MTNLKYILLLICVGVALQGIAQQPFSAGNIVVYRVGDGSAALDGNATKVYLDEYTPDGTLVQSLSMPTAVSGSNNILTAFGSDASSGMLNLSTSGKYLIVPGINTAPGGAASGAAVMGLVDFNGTINTSTAITDYTESLNVPWTGMSDNGSRIWFGGVGAIRYAAVGSSTSTLVSGFTGQSKDLKIANGQLYSGTSNSPKIFTVGSGLPVSASQSLTALPGLPTNIQGPGQFAFADLDPTVPGVDVLYVASTHTAANAVIGIRKFSLVNGTWVGNGSIGGTVANSYFVGLTLKVSANTVTLFATRQGSNNISRGGELVKIIDNSGYNQTMTGTPVVIASVSTPNTMAFRGVALVPQPAPFTAGDIVVYRVGDGSAVLDGNVTKVYLDEYTTDGTLVQSFLMPTAANGTNNVLTAIGSDASSGMLNLSTDGKYLIVPGVNTAPGGGAASSAAVIGLVDFNGKINTSTAVTDYTESLNIPWTGISDNGSHIWFGGVGAIRYATVGSSTSTLISAFTGQCKDLKITDGQLYSATSNSPKLFMVGSGLPVSASQTLTALPGLPTNIQGPGQYAFADLDPTVPGMDVLYVASTHTAANSVIGIRKFSLVNGTWVGNGSVGGTVANSYFVGLTLKVSANTVTLFATRQGANNISRGGELVKIVDNSGYNQTMTGTPVVIASAAIPNTIAFRGVALVPLGCPAVTGLRVPDISATQARLTWNAVSAGSNYEYAVSTTNTPPASGTVTTNTSVNLTGLSNNITYYAHVRTACSGLSTSEWSTVSFLTGCNSPAVPQLMVTVTGSGTATVTWNQVFGASSYEYALGTSATPPATGNSTSDTSVSKADLNAVTQYYVHVRSVCDGGAFSNWVSKAFTTSCFIPTANITVLQNNTGVTWNKINNAVRYEYAFTNTAANPVTGTATTDTFYLTGKFREGAGYYFHVRSFCSTGSVSEWGTVKLNTPGMQVYPNPVNENLNIQLNGAFNAGAQITIADVMGRIVTQLKMTGNTITIDARALMPGIYIVRYDDGTNRQIVRVMKQ